MPGHGSWEIRRRQVARTFACTHSKISGRHKEGDHATCSAHRKSRSHPHSIRESGHGCLDSRALGTRARTDTLACAHACSLGQPHRALGALRSYAGMMSMALRQRGGWKWSLHLFEAHQAQSGPSQSAQLYAAALRACDHGRQWQLLVPKYEGRPNPD